MENEFSVDVTTGHDQERGAFRETNIYSRKDGIIATVWKDQYAKFIADALNAGSPPPLNQ